MGIYSVELFGVALLEMIPPLVRITSAVVYNTLLRGYDDGSSMAGGGGDGGGGDGGDGGDGGLGVKPVKGVSSCSRKDPVRLDIISEFSSSFIED